SRLAKGGVIALPRDVFYLAVQELVETASSLLGLDRRSEVRERQSTMERFGAIRPPATIGTMPWIDPPDDPFGRSLGRVFGESPIPSARHITTPSERNIVRGHAASPGIVRGRARVVQ